IGAREKSGAVRGPPFYGEEDVELRVDLFPEFLEFIPGCISAEQVAGEEARLFRQIIGRKFMIHAATSKSALMRGHTDDRAALVVLIQGFDVRERIIEFIDGCAVRFEVVQPLCPFVMDKARALSATADHPTDGCYLQIEERLRLDPSRSA